jgi:hypothetical protein
MYCKSASYPVSGIWLGKIVIFLLSCAMFSGKIQAQNEFISPSEISMQGMLGQAIVSSEKGRLLALPTWEDGELINVFSEESRDKNEKNDWYGEHGGKWLYSAALAVERSKDEKLKSLLFQTADFLINTQGKDGYLGTYSPARRITNKNALTHGTSWDVWNLSYMVLGLLEVNRYFPNEKYLDAATKIGELFLKTFGDGRADITNYGTRKGMSATIILEPVVELFRVTKDLRYIVFAEWIIRKIEEKEGFRIVSESLKKTDGENIGDGKAYQLIWNLAAIAKLYQETKNDNYLKAVENGWQNITDFHLTESGGPWGGIGKHLECFNKKGYWSPYGFVETCSIMAWMQLNRELLRITGHAKYAQAIERSAYNALLGAQFPNGTDWCYHSFSNGSRHIAHFNDCCPSSGALALEEIPQLIYSKKGNSITCNLYTACEASVSLPDAGLVRLVQKTDYPFKGTIQIIISPEKQTEFPLIVRIPDWASSAEIKINGKQVNTDKLISGEFFLIRQVWKKNDQIEIAFPIELKVFKKQEYTNAPQGGKSIYSTEWFSLTRGPLVYSCNGLINGRDREKTFMLSEKNKEACFAPIAAPSDFHGPAYELKLPGQEAQIFLPYYEAGGRTPGSWRLTWIQRKIE